jgi:NitT/TauT family transport system substrate-binding protein
MKNSLKPAVWIASAIFILVNGVVAAWIYAGTATPERPAGPPEPLTIAVNSTYVGSGLVLIAAASGYFSAEGLAVTIQSHTTGRAALDSMLQGRADFATAAEGPLMFAVMKGAPAAIVATISTESGAHGIVARKDRGIAAPADLKGKRIGATLGTSSHFFIDVVLVERKVPAREVHIMNFRPEQMADALLAGKVDAVSTWEPYFGLSKEALGDAGAVMRTDGNFFVTFNVVGQRDFIRNNPATMKKLLRALIRAEEFAAKRPGEARALVASAIGIEVPALEALWPAFSLRVRLEQDLLTLLEAQSRWAIGNGHVDKTGIPNYLDFIYPDAMVAVRPDALTIIR